MQYTGCSDCIYYDECGPDVFTESEDLLCYTDGDFRDLVDAEFDGEIYWMEMSWYRLNDGWLDYGCDSEWDYFLNHG